MNLSGVEYIAQAGRPKDFLLVAKDPPFVIGVRNSSTLFSRFSDQSDLCALVGFEALVLCDHTDQIEIFFDRHPEAISVVEMADDWFTLAFGRTAMLATTKTPPLNVRDLSNWFQSDPFDYGHVFKTWNGLLFDVDVLIDHLKDSAWLQLSRQLDEKNKDVFFRLDKMRLREKDKKNFSKKFGDNVIPFKKK